MLNTTKAFRPRKLQGPAEREARKMGREGGH